MPLGAICNNNCVFCMEDDREGRRRVNSAMRGERVTQVLRENLGADEVCFTSGEPTLHPELPLFIRQARDFGYQQVSVISNGRRLAYPGYASQLVRAGLTCIYVSIHGHTAALHDGLTRTPGSFVQTAAGIDAMAAFRRRGVKLCTSTVLTTRNTPVLTEIYDWLLDRGVDQAIFNALQVTGRAERLVGQIVPRYAEVRSSFERLLVESPDRGDRAFLVDVPLCVTEGLPDHCRGWVERRTHFEVDSSAPDAAPDRADSTLRRVENRDLDNANRQHGPGCARCVYRAVCPGVYKVYADHFGWSELVPVETSSTNAAP